MKQLLLICVLALSSGCAFLHHAHVGDIDNREGYELRPIDIKMSETGISLQEATEVVKALNNSSQGQKDIAGVSEVIGLFQMGPKTGNTVYNDTYAHSLVYKLHEACPSGMITGINAIRETRKYPVVSGEIVKVTGFCMIKKG